MLTTLIIARTQQTLIDTFGKLKDISSQYGLIVNESKTKYMKCTRRENTLGKLRAGDIQIDQVKSFSYLGSTVNGKYDGRGNNRTNCQRKQGILGK
jgi:hypothetical protein